MDVRSSARRRGAAAQPVDQLAGGRSPCPSPCSGAGRSRWHSRCRRPARRSRTSPGARNRSWSGRRRRHAHDLVLAVEHLEARELGQRAVEAAERIRVVELLDLVDLAVLADAEEGRRVFALCRRCRGSPFFGEARGNGSARDACARWCSTGTISIFRSKPSCWRHHSMRFVAEAAAVAGQDRVEPNGPARTSSVLA